MKDIRRVFISDLHLASTEAVQPETGMPYGWLSPERARRTGQFLRSKIVTDCQQLFLVGDVIDRWICPHDVKPPTGIEILDAPHNKPIVDGIRAFAETPGKTVIWCKGNHDAEVTTGDAHHVSFNVNLVPRYDGEFPLRVVHGHEGALFNAPDPAGREFPLGYFISRFVATAAARGLKEVGLSLQLLWHSGPELMALLNSHPLAECVFDAVCHAADLSLEDKMIMPDGSVRTLSEVRATYRNLVEDWKAHRTLSVRDAVLSEWDPYYDLPAGKKYLYIAGHSHDFACSVLNTGVRYLNVGAWCGKEAHFGRTWLEDPGTDKELLCGQGFAWDPVLGITDRSTILRVPT